MQKYFYNESSQTENILPFLLAASSSQIANSGTVIMPQLRKEDESAYPASYFPFGDKVKLINDYSLPQIQSSFYTQNVSIGADAMTSIFYEQLGEEESVKTEKESLIEKIINLFNILGKDLFSKLTYGQLLFMVNTAGAVDLGKSVNIDRMYGYINQY